MLDALLQPAQEALYLDLTLHSARTHDRGMLQECMTRHGVHGTIRRASTTAVSETYSVGLGFSFSFLRRVSLTRP